jgi:hypothetical protein
MKKELILFQKRSMLYYGKYRTNQYLPYRANPVGGLVRRREKRCWKFGGKLCLDQKGIMSFLQLHELASLRAYVRQATFAGMTTESSGYWTNE